MNGKKRVISTKDGRKLSLVEAGPVDGMPVLVLHGTPVSSLLFTPWIVDAQSRGMRLISYSRPGFSNSTPQPGRKVANAAEDVAAIAKELKLDRLYLWGYSGGGPHAMACAALLPDLVVAAACLASPAPFGSDEFDWFAGMTEGNIEEFRMALEGREVLKPYLETASSRLLSADPVSIVTAFQSVLCPTDVEALAGDIGRYLVDAGKDAIQKGVDGWIDDDLAFVHSWGFQLDQIQIPVLLIHGEKDRLIPCAHGKWLAGKIQSVDARFYPEDGHMTMGTKHIPEVHDWFQSK